MNSDTKNVRRGLKNINSISTFNALLEDLMISDEDKEILTLIYVKKKTLSYIADTYGYSESTIKNKHRRVLKIIASMI